MRKQRRPPGPFSYAKILKLIYNLGMHVRESSTSKKTSSSNVAVAFFLNLFFIVFEIIGGLFTNSLAILSDALHDLGDTFSLGLSWYLEKVSKRKRTKSFSYGYKRFSLLAAFINSAILVMGAIFIISKAIPRLLHPEPANAKGMLLLAIVGILVNGVAVLRLRGGKTMNERVITWHLLEDVFGWAAVLIISVVMMFGEFYIFDPILSLILIFYILWNALKNFKATAMIFLQSVPGDIDMDNIEKKILTIPKVKAVHDTHIWSLDGATNILTAHIIIDKKSSKKEALDIKCKTKALLDGQKIVHSTLEVEFEGETCPLELKPKQSK